MAPDGNVVFLFVVFDFSSICFFIFGVIFGIRTPLRGSREEGTPLRGAIKAYF